MKVDTVWGVYHADGGIMGELRYVIGAVFQGNHCSLCDITHKLAWEKKQMKEMRKDLGIPFNLVHLNEQPDDLLDFTRGMTPIVVGETNSGFVTLATDQELQRCKGSVDDLFSLISSKLE
tara:strand:+ start:155 stop:514 length:360 start_codon:yes stop_codon:yes gene_type:complete